MSPHVRRTERFGRYTCDPVLMMSAILAVAAQVRAQTAYEPCAVQANPIDLKALSAHMFPDTDGAVPPTEIVGMWVLQDETVSLGVAEILQCALPHPSPQDCVYHPRTARRFTKGPL